jgi:hypothetical protein
VVPRADLHSFAENISYPFKDSKPWGVQPAARRPSSTSKQITNFKLGVIIIVIIII